MVEQQDNFPDKLRFLSAVDSKSFKDSNGRCWELTGFDDDITNITNLTSDFSIQKEYPCCDMCLIDSLPNIDDEILSFDFESPSFSEQSFSFSESSEDFDGGGYEYGYDEYGYDFSSLSSDSSYSYDFSSSSSSSSESSSSSSSESSSSSSSESSSSSSSSSSSQVIVNPATTSCIDCSTNCNPANITVTISDLAGTAEGDPWVGTVSCNDFNTAINCSEGYDDCTWSGSEYIASTQMYVFANLFCFLDEWFLSITIANSLETTVYDGVVALSCQDGIISGSGTLLRSTGVFCDESLNWSITS